MKRFASSLLRGIFRFRYFLVGAAFTLFSAGCAGVDEWERLPAEDLEVQQFYGDLIKVLKDPKIRPNSREKYEAAKELVKHVDFELTREVKTLNDIFYHGDAIIDTPRDEDRQISFFYQYGDHYVRLSFWTFRNAVLRVKVLQK